MSESQIVRKISPGVIRPIQRGRIYSVLAAYVGAGLPAASGLRSLAGAFQQTENPDVIADNLTDALNSITDDEMRDNEARTADVEKPDPILQDRRVVRAIRSAMRASLQPEEASLLLAADAVSDRAALAILLNTAASLVVGPLALIRSRNSDQ
jgi:hypothetical protein